MTHTIAWAREAAGRGDVAEALGWLDVVEAVEGGLPRGLQSLRAEWLEIGERREAA